MQAYSIAEMMAKRRNLQALHDRLALVQAVKQGEQAIKDQLACDDFGGAFKLSTESAAVVRDQLSGVRCLQNVVAKISGLSEQVSIVVRVTVTVAQRSQPRLSVCVSGAPQNGE